MAKRRSRTRRQKPAAEAPSTHAKKPDVAGAVAAPPVEPPAKPATGSDNRRTIQAAIGYLQRRFFRLQLEKRRVRQNQEYNDRLDAESLQNAALPEGESVRLSSVWVVEIYLPSHIDALQRNLRQVGLGRADVFSGTDPIESVLEGRVRGGGTWPANLGSLVPKTRANRAWRARPADLPEGVTLALFDAVSSISGATTVIAQFIFDDETAAQIEEPFRTHYRSTAVLKKDGVIGLPHGAHLRYEAVTDLRARLRRRCERWMRTNLPGAFAGFGDAAIPTCELLTFVTGDPFCGRERPRREENAVRLVGPEPPGRRLTGIGFGDEDYLTILGQKSSHGAWGCVETEGLTLRFGTDASKALRSEDYLVLSARISDFVNEGGGATGTLEAVQHGARWMNYTLSLFALSRLLIVIEEHLAEIRDRLGSVPLGSNRRAVRRMGEIERDLAQITRDVRPLALGVAAAHEWTWRSEVRTFLALDEWERPAGPLFSRITHGITDRAAKLLASEDDTRNIVRGIGELVSASANLSVARTNLLLQAITILIGILAAILAALAIPELHQFLLRLVGR